MKKLFVLSCVMLGITSVHAQVLTTTVQDTVATTVQSTPQYPTFSYFSEKGNSGSSSFLPNKLGASLGVGTTGVTFDLSTQFSDYIGLRAGVDWVPNVKVNADLDLSKVSGLSNTDPAYSQFLADNGVASLPNNLKVQGKLNMTTFHFLIDVYPFAEFNSLHLTVGGYFGSKKIVKVYNKDEGALKAVSNFNSSLTGVDRETHVGTFIYGSNTPISGVKQIGVELGDYFLEPTTDGNLNASIQVAGFRPYVGIGIGRAVPRNRIGVQCDLGCQFWGTPDVYVNGKNGEEKLTKENTNGEGGDALKILSKITVYPTLTIRLTGRIF